MFLIGYGVGSFVAFVVFALLSVGKEDDEINFKNK